VAAATSNVGGTYMTTNSSDAEKIYSHFLANLAPLLKSNLLINRYSADRLLITHPNPLTMCGGKVYSQNDEDGITFEILRRLRIDNGAFAEFGVGNGLENNTLALVAAGWSGFWVGGEELAFNTNPNDVAALNFYYRRVWITLGNIIETYQIGLQQIRRDQCDVISLDMDGNDYYFVDALLSAGAAPKLFIVEYNAKFIPPILFKIDYDDEHKWNGDDYFGASLRTLAELFEKHGYLLVCCNITGANAFFVRIEFKRLFSDIPKELEKLYASPKYFLTGLDFPGHPTSLKTLESLFRKLNSGA
jgi:hypothetical protein